MTNFDQRFSNYKTPQGLTLQLEENEHVVIDGFDCMCSGFPSMYGFLTNKRFIFRQTNFNYGMRYSSLFNADCLTINLDEVEYISLHRGLAYFPRTFTMRVKGTVTDYSKEQEKNTDLFLFSLRPGGFGHSPATLYERLTTQLSILGKECNFETLFFGRNANLGEMSSERALDIEKGQRRRQIIAMPASVLAYSFFALFFGAPLFIDNNSQLVEAQNQAAQQTNSVPQFDPSTIVQPQRDATGQFDYVIQERRGYDTTCFSTAYPGSDGNTSKMFGCTIRSSWEPGTSVKVMDVLWSDGVRTTVRLNNGFGAAIGGGSNWERGTWEFYRHEGKNYFYIKADKGADTWIPTEAFDLGLKR